jgi:Raf kinase inhibitor-like protein, YbhB/YbcL family
MTAMVFSMAIASGLGMVPPEGVPMKIETPAFQQGKKIPKKYTCQGANVSPPLFFIDAPKETVTFVLIVDDPDAPGGTFDHWIAWNIPGTTKSLPEAAKLNDQGTNGYGKKNYQGPCPPPGKLHRYFFKLYALDIKLTIPEGVSKGQLEKAVEGHVLAKAEHMGIFQR